MNNNITNIKKAIKSAENKLFTQRSNLGYVLDELKELEGAKYVARKRYVLNKKERAIMNKIENLKNEINTHQNSLKNLEIVKKEKKEITKKVAKEKRVIKRKINNAVEKQRNKDLKIMEGLNKLMNLKNKKSLNKFEVLKNFDPIRDAKITKKQFHKNKTWTNYMIENYYYDGLGKPSVEDVTIKYKTLIKNILEKRLNEGPCRFNLKLETLFEHEDNEDNQAYDPYELDEDEKEEAIIFKNNGYDYDDMRTGIINTDMYYDTAKSSAFDYLINKFFEFCKSNGYNDVNEDNKIISDALKFKDAVGFDNYIKNNIKDHGGIGLPKMPEVSLITFSINLYKNDEEYKILKDEEIKIDRERDDLRKKFNKIKNDLIKNDKVIEKLLQKDDLKGNLKRDNLNKGEFIAFLGHLNPVITNMTEFDDVFEKHIKRILEDYDNVRNKSSQINYKGVLSINVSLSDYNPLKTGNYIDLPEEIKNKQACINPKNEDDEKCFIYATTLGYHIDNEKFKKNPQEVSKIKKFLYNKECELDFSYINTYPVTIDDINNFERYNVKDGKNLISINVYELKLEKRPVDKKICGEVMKLKNEGVDEYY